MNVKIIKGRAYTYYVVIATIEQYKRLKLRNPSKQFRKFGNIVYVDVDVEYLKQRGVK
jgi:hypothetical protein